MGEKSEVTGIDRVRITGPCPAPWIGWKDMEEVEGEGEHVRHCQHCDLHVYRFSKMTRSEVTKVVEEHGGNLCAIIRRRQDGTIITLEEPTE